MFRNSTLALVPSVVLVLIGTAEIRSTYAADPSPAATPGLPLADPPGAFARDRNFDMQKLDLLLQVDPVAHAVAGTAMWTIRRLGPGDLRLDAVSLALDGVRVDDVVVSVVPGARELTIPIPDAPIGTVSTVSIHYHAHPQLGLHWRGPPSLGGGADSPDTRAEVWSQGEGEDNRYWFPSYDHPDDRFEYSGKFTITGVADAAKWTVVTNSGADLPSYLVMLAAAQYETFTGGNTPAVLVQPGPERLRSGPAPHVAIPPLVVNVPPGTPESWVKPILDPLPDMMDWFAQRTGVPYAWGTYTQTFVQRFIYGGMENTGSTIMSTRMLVPPTVHATRSSTASIVAHELAHQWFGDLLTARTAREMWLNEGFATFFAADWEVHARRAKDGDGAADALAAAQIDGWRRGSLDIGSLAGRWALGGGGATHAGSSGVGVTAGEANHNVYAKGAMVLTMLRRYLGEDTFWAGIQDYTRGHAHSSVDTIDLERAMEARSGKDLAWFFEQWTELPSVPKVTTEWTWTAGANGAAGAVAVEIHEANAAYVLPIDISVDGATPTRAWLRQGALTVTIPAASAPRFVAIDPTGGLLVDWDQQQSEDAWIAELADPAPYARLQALHALADMPERDADPLAALLSDATILEPLREAVADAIGTRRSCDPLLALLSDKDERLRGAGANALGRCYNRDLVAPMLTALASESNSDNRAALLRSAAAIDPVAVMPTARKELARADALDPERTAAATAFAVGGAPSDVPSLLRVPVSRDVRLAGIRSSVAIEKRQTLGPARDALRASIARSAERLLSDLDLRGIQGGIGVLKDVGDAQSAALLEALARSTTLPDTAKSAHDAVTAINARVETVTPATPNEIDARLKALEDRVKAVEDEDVSERH